MNFIFCKFRKNSNTIPLNAVVFIKKSIFCYKFETRILNCTGKWGGMSKKKLYLARHIITRFMLCQNILARNILQIPNLCIVNRELQLPRLHLQHYALG